MIRMWGHTHAVVANMRSKEMSLVRFLAQNAVARFQSDSQDSASLSCVEVSQLCHGVVVVLGFVVCLLEHGFCLLASRCQAGYSWWQDRGFLSWSCKRSGSLDLQAVGHRRCRGGDLFVPKWPVLAFSGVCVCVCVSVCVCVW